MDKAYAQYSGYTGEVVSEEALKAQHAEVRRKADEKYSEQVTHLAELLYIFATGPDSVTRDTSEEMAEMLISLGWDRDAY